MTDNGQAEHGANVPSVENPRRTGLTLSGRAASLMMEIGSHAAEDRDAGHPIQGYEASEEMVRTAQAQIRQLDLRLISLIQTKGEGVTYDEFYETAIQHYPPSLVSRFLAGYERGRGEIYRRIDSIVVERVRALGEQYVSLLIDPGIGMGDYRRYDFLAFAEQTLAQEPSLSPLELRRRFIATFEEKTYYRGKIVRDDRPELHMSHVSGDIEREISRRNSSDFLQQVSSALRLPTPQAQADQLGNIGLPVVGGSFYEAGIRHIGSGETFATPFLSVSQYPEISYYALADNGEQRWRNPDFGWDGHQSIVISRFRMSSFYALDRRDTWLYPNPQHKTYDIGNLHGLPVDAYGVEALVPVALPPLHDADQRTFTPPFDDPGSIPTASNWGNQ